MRTTLLLLFFSLSLHADGLRVGVELDPERVEFRVTVANDGLDPAIAPRLRMELTPALPIATSFDFESLGWTCSRTTGVIDCTRDALQPGTAQTFFVFIAAAGQPIAPGRYTLTAEVRTTNDSARASVVRTIGHGWTVTSDADSGAGTLRAAIAEANAICDGDLPCGITFFDHPEIIPKTIFLRSPLPVITACDLTIYSAKRPPDLSDVTWGINGFDVAAGEGLVFRPSCEDSHTRIDGFTVTSFPGDGIAVLGPLRGTYDFTRLGVSGRSRGIAVDAPRADVRITRSTIGNTARSAITLWSANSAIVENVRVGVSAQGARLPVGASGIFVGPTGGNLTVRSSILASARHFGIALARGNANVTLDSAILTNNLAGDIDWGLDGPTPNDPADSIPDTPRLYSATYDAARNVTRIVSDPSVQLWASGGLSIFSTGHLEQFLGAVDGTGVLEVPGDLRGRYVSALRVERRRVSEVSFAVRVQ
jgi:Right handed beta helix region